jgi:hypothetical protein
MCQNGPKVRPAHQKSNYIKVRQGIFYTPRAGAAPGKLATRRSL